MTNLSASYGRIEVVHDVTFAVPKGSVFALVGPNGSGQVHPVEGAERVQGTGFGAGGGRRHGDHQAHCPTTGSPKVCTLPEGRAIFPNLTVRENLRMFTFRGKDVLLSTVEEQSFEQFPVLKERSSQLAGRLSGGEQQMLAICRALATQPNVLFLDELSMGLAPTIVAQLYERPGRLGARRQLTIVVVEQFASLALQVADRAGVMIGGRLVHVGQPDRDRRCPGRCLSRIKGVT